MPACSFTRHSNARRFSSSNDGSPAPPSHRGPPAVRPAFWIRFMALVASERTSRSQYSSAMQSAVRGRIAQHAAAARRRAAAAEAAAAEAAAAGGGGEGAGAEPEPSTEEVAAVLGYCHEHAIPVVPQGGSLPCDAVLVLNSSKWGSCVGALVDEIGTGHLCVHLVAAALEERPLIFHKLFNRPCETDVVSDGCNYNQCVSWLPSFGLKCKNDRFFLLHIAAAHVTHNTFEDGGVET